MAKKISTWMLIIISSSLLLACGSLQKKPEPILSNDIINKDDKSMPEFTGLAIQGPYDIDVNIIPQQAYINMRGNGQLVDLTNYYVKDGVLHVFADQRYDYTPYSTVKLTIEMPTIERLSYVGSGKIQITDINTPHLVLNAEGSGYIYLSGKATRLDATLSGTSRLNAKCLLARTIFVNTVDLAQAEVASNNGVSALAADSSDIYYYEHPKLAAKYENRSGSVLRMEGIAEARPDNFLPAPIMQPNGAVMTPYLFNPKNPLPAPAG